MVGFFLALSLSAQATAPQRAELPILRIEPPEGDSGGPAPAALEPLALTQAMGDWAKARVTSLGSDDEVMRRLMTLVANELPLTYADSHTGTAEEVFREGRYNCLALAHLLVALGRNLGVDTYYVRIETLESFHRRGELIVVSTHVAAAWGPSRQVRIVEVDPATAREQRASVRITDEQAKALHYTNLGAEALRRGQPREALSWLDRALAADGDLPEAWVNRGVALRRLGDPEGAERAYREAIERDANDLSAWRNLASLLTSQGDHDGAKTLLHLLDRRDNTNPFAYLALGDANAADNETAVRFYRRGLRYDRANPLLQAAMGEWALATGDRAAAARWLARAERVDAEDPRVAALRRAFTQP